MSWMDSWSRPSKHAATPPPLYLTSSDPIPYCHSCGRVISQRKSTSKSAQPVKYCSARCRNNKPGPVDRKIESVFAQLLNGASVDSLVQGAEGGPVQEVIPDKPKEKGHKKSKSKTIKGDPRRIVECDTVQSVVFQRAKDPDKVYGRRKNRAARGVVERPEDWKSVDMISDPETEPAVMSGQVVSKTGQSNDELSDSDEHEDQGGINLELDTVPLYGYGGGKVRPPQAKSEVNGSIGGEKGWAEKIEETDEMRSKRLEGQRRAEEREMVRRAARRGCAFGFEVDGEEEKRKCEAVMKGAAVEPSFAKGEWGVRWREKN
ncbi:hypothetical protein BS50DRAFT_573558 [Corynespora cassiicola Philippines]|uniref:Uncharacterized protein n=1 Tax=Corynespora cassiicola Philippines TaxID=1448308 RepID=A0A2T2NN90_CORCC|nr:hypothetical protein BS50DRAFT_573558 [Corynespora cassiicola Philippines]